MSRYRGGPTNTLYVRNISDRVRYEDLRRLFQKYGKLVDVTIPLDYYSGLPKGYCFVEYPFANKKIK
jgi:RNA recognition motif-containing protein